MFAAQCPPYEVAANSISSTEVQISWKCFEPSQLNEFAVTFTLINKDHCNAQDPNLYLAKDVDCSSCNRYRVMSDNDDVYSYYHYLNGLHPYSIYTYSVKARITTSTGDTFVWTPTEVSSFTTSEAGKCRDANVIMQNK